MMNTRRNFLARLAGTAWLPLLCQRGLAQADSPPVKVKESDPVALALGYKEDTTKVDSKKYPFHTKDQKCATCALFQAQPGQALAPCTVFGSKTVPPNAWCSAYAKRPEAAK